MGDRGLKHLVVVMTLLGVGPAFAKPVDDGWHLYALNDANDANNCKNILAVSREQKEKWPQTVFGEREEPYGHYKYPPLTNNDAIRIGDGHAQGSIHHLQKKGDKIKLTSESLVETARMYTADGTPFIVAIENKGMYRTEEDFYLTSSGEESHWQPKPKNNDGDRRICRYFDESEADDNISECQPFETIDMTAAIEKARVDFTKKVAVKNAEALLSPPTNSFQTGLFGSLVGWPITFRKTGIEEGYTYPSYLIVSSSYFWQSAPDSPAILKHGNPQKSPLSVLAFKLVKNDNEGGRGPVLAPACLFIRDMLSTAIKKQK